MESIIIIVHVIAAIAIIGLVLIQHGKGADMGASFGSGGSQTMFGAVGSGNALTKSTTVFAVVFFLTSLSLGVVARNAADLSVVDNSLIGNIEQVNDNLSAEAQAALTDLPVIDAPQLQVGDLPVVDTLTIDTLPVVDTLTEPEE